MTWQKLTLSVPSSSVEKFNDLIDEADALAVTLEANSTEELFEPPLGTTPLWQRTTIHALFTMDTDLSPLLSTLTTAIYPETLSYQTTIIADEDWQKNFMASVKPTCFADKLWVYPSWHTLPDDHKPCVLLDPGLAFGTGSHATTRLCLEWLAQNIKGGECVVDYGCGSGILSLAALKLGAKKVWAVDNDPQAIEATLENTRRNQINGDAIEVVLPEALPLLQVDVLIANILANPLIELAPHFANLLGRNGKIVLSGILIEQIDMVMNAYVRWFDFSKSVRETWVCLVGKLRCHPERSEG